jgi:hypothetical protein
VQLEHLVHTQFCTTIDTGSNLSSQVMINRVSIWLALTMTVGIWALLVSPAVPSVPSLLPISQLLACFIVGVVLLSSVERLPQFTTAIVGPVQNRPPSAASVVLAVSLPLRR